MSFSMEMCSYRSATFYIFSVTSSDFHEIFTNSQEHRVTHKEMEIPTINYQKRRTTCMTFIQFVRLLRIEL